MKSRSVTSFQLLAPLFATQTADSAQGHDFDFGDPAAEVRAALAGDIISPLTAIGTLRVSGADLDSFLQGQLSNDVRQLAAGKAQLHSWNSARGRVLALFNAIRTEDAVLLETSRSLLDHSLKRLRMFVLRSKVKIEDAGTGFVAVGLGGDGAAAALGSLGLPAPETAGTVVAHDGIRVLRRAGARPRFSLHGSVELLGPLWSQLHAQLRPVGSAAWRLLDILAGMPAIVPATQDRFVAQMLNLDDLGGISFNKGCYTGQEVIARLHYLGQLKKRMFLLFTERAAPVAPSMSIYAADGDGQAVGEVVCSAPHPEHGHALLAVLQLAQAHSAQLRLESPDGSSLRVSPFPPQLRERGTIA